MTEDTSGSLALGSKRPRMDFFGHLATGAGMTASTSGTLGTGVRKSVSTAELTMALVTWEPDMWADIGLSGTFSTTVA